MPGRVGLIVWVGMIVGTAVNAMADPPAYLELTVKDQPQRGKLLAMDRSTVWLMSREGRLSEFDAAGRQRLQAARARVSARECRRGPRRPPAGVWQGFWIVAASEHYLVCAPAGKAGDYVKLFEEIYRSFRGYFGVRGFRMAPPEFPLVAIVFPDQKSFHDYCKADRVPAPPGLRGYYLRTSNRVALYDLGRFRNRSVGRKPSLRRKFVHANIQANLADTIVHEATHQAAFNTGLHSRIGVTPKWVVEGLATVFEAPGIRDSASVRGKAIQRVNKERYVHFQNYAQARRGPKSLAEFVSSDKPFESSRSGRLRRGLGIKFLSHRDPPLEVCELLKDHRRPRPDERLSASGTP